jgi:hypothetical protein
MDKYLKPYTTLAVGILLGAIVAPRRSANGQGITNG